MPPSPCHAGQKPVVIRAGLVAKDVTFVAAAANDSAYRQRRYVISTLSVPGAPAAEARRTIEEAAGPALSATPLALADAWTSAHLALWERYVADTARRPVHTLTGSSLARLMIGSATINVAFASACFESLAGLGGATR